MLNKLQEFIRRYHLLEKGDHVVCALSGGADSVAMTFALQLLASKLEITVSAAHFNHKLRGAESDEDEAFVRSFCRDYRIPLQVACEDVKAGKKGLEAAAREARYAFLCSLHGKIATAHTADDNAETVLMHLVRGTGLKGLGGIRPVRASVIRPMLCITRREVLEFLQEYSLPYVEDRSNFEDDFLRNRLRHHVMPLLKQENPRLAMTLTETALRLREDEEALEYFSQEASTEVKVLREMPKACRTRALMRFLNESGVAEPSARHLQLLESLVFSWNPSSSIQLPGGVIVCREYGRITVAREEPVLKKRRVNCPGVTPLPELGLQIRCLPLDEGRPSDLVITPKGDLFVRHRMPGDTLRMWGGTKSLKELYIDAKIPAPQRMRVPVLADDHGVLAVYGVDAPAQRPTGEGSFCICFEQCCVNDR